MAQNLDSWFAGRLPKTWFLGPPEVSADGDEVVVLGTLPDVELAKDTSAVGRSPVPLASIGFGRRLAKSASRSLGRPSATSSGGSPGGRAAVTRPRSSPPSASP